MGEGVPDVDFLIGGRTDPEDCDLMAGDTEAPDAANSLEDTPTVGACESRAAEDLDGGGGFMLLLLTLLRSVRTEAPPPDFDRG